MDNQGQRVMVTVQAARAQEAKEKEEEEDRRPRLRAEKLVGCGQMQPVLGVSCELHRNVLLCCVTWSVYVGTGCDA